MFMIMLAIDSLASSLSQPAFLAAAPKMLKEKMIRTRQKMLTNEIDVPISCS
jgi:hypothetical protein